MSVALIDRMRRSRPGLHDMLRVAEVDDQIRQAATTIYHALMDAELTGVIGAAPTNAPTAGWHSATAHDRR